MQKAFEELKIYLNKKSKEEEAIFEFKNVRGINERQAQIIKLVIKKTNTILISKDLEYLFGVSVKTIRSDLNGLVGLNLFEIVPINQRLMGYTRVKDFEEKLAHLGEIRRN